MKDFEQREALNQLAGYSRHDWLISYDAIIPLIQKQSRNILVRIVLSLKGQNDVARMVDWLLFTPTQLCEALLRATGKWIEEPNELQCKHEYQEDSTVCAKCGA